MFRCPLIVHVWKGFAAAGKINACLGKYGHKVGSSLPIKPALEPELLLRIVRGLRFVWMLNNVFPKRLKRIVLLFPLQGGSSRVPQEKERVRQMSGKPRGCVGKPKQDPDWRVESTEGHLLPQSWVAAAVCGQGLKTVPLTNCYSKTKKEKTLEQKLLWLSLFLCSLRPGLRRIQKCPGEFE